MSDPSKELAELKQQIIDEVNAKQNANSAELNEEELESISGGNMNMGVRTISASNQDFPRIVNMNMGVRNISASNQDFPKIVNHNMGARTMSASNQDFPRIVNMNMGVRNMKTDE